mmetsp:Transcript_76923/g.195243  ORF Transcript_76923/g.195243 Transcript_76923/m.195243 type:complete len:263 (+) Transcript_76923:110-898(+)
MNCSTATATFAEASRGSQRSACSGGSRDRLLSAGRQRVGPNDCEPTLLERYARHERRSGPASRREAFMTFTEARELGTFGQFRCRTGGGGGGDGAGGSGGGTPGLRSDSAPSLRRPNADGELAAGKTFNEVYSGLVNFGWTPASRRRTFMTFTEVRDTSGSFGKFMYRGGGMPSRTKSRTPSPCRGSWSGSAGARGPCPRRLPRATSSPSLRGGRPSTACGLPRATPSPAAVRSAAARSATARAVGRSHSAGSLGSLRPTTA